MIIKKKLRDVNSEEFKGWKQKNCIGSHIAKCSKCVFKGYNCDYFSEGVWVNNKSLCSKKFLNQKIEVGGILTKDEEEYLRAVIKPFRGRILNIRKEETESANGGMNEFIEVYVKPEFETGLRVESFCLPRFVANAMFKEMKLSKKYLPEKLGL